MSFALNEIDAMAKRATRGAGYSWGLAEEAAKATRWLCAQNLDGCAVLAGVLQAGFAPALPDHTPTAQGGIWQGQGTLCPLASGAMLSDRAARIGQAPVTLQNVTQPALILPFAAAVARQTGDCITVTCGPATAVTDGRAMVVAAPFPDSAATLTVQAGGACPGQPVLASRATPATDAWAILDRLAQRTYAPATEESRLLGAGSGLSDND